MLQERLHTQEDVGRNVAAIWKAGRVKRISRVCLDVQASTIA